MLNKKMKEVLSYCKRDNLDKGRLASFWPKNIKEITDLPVYTLNEIDKLHDIIDQECSIGSQNIMLLNKFSSIRSCSALFIALDESRNGIGVDVVELLLTPFEDLPLMVNTIDERLRLFVRWRLDIGK